jgi:hypothetical protein
VVAIAPLFVAETPRQAGRFDLAGAASRTADHRRGSLLPSCGR